jgi:hypothetical protein
MEGPDTAPTLLEDTAIGSSYRMARKEFKRVFTERENREKAALQYGYSSMERRWVKFEWCVRFCHGSLRIGCVRFQTAATKVIQRWALR